MPSSYFPFLFGLALEGLLAEVQCPLWGVAEDPFSEDGEVVAGFDGFGPSHGKL